MNFLFQRKNLVPAIIIIVFLLTSFNVGFYLGKTEGEKLVIQGVVNKNIGQPDGVDFSLFWDAWVKIQNKYVGSGELNYQDMVYGAIAGMVKSLKDPYTVFLPPEESKIFLEDISGSFSGVGMEIGIRKGQLTVISPLENTPAQEAGIRAGDKILEVDGKPTSEITIEEAVSMIRGEKGTQVSLMIYRTDWEKPREIKIERNIIKVPSLKWELIDGGDIAYIKLYHFSQEADYEFSQASREIINSSAKRIILDLRNNPGGFLDVAQNIAGWFLERGDIVVIEDFGGAEENKEHNAAGNSELLKYPVVILINQGSASGSEILAGALRDNRDIKLIGETSFGKGSVQELEKLQGGASLKITIAKWLTPKGELIADVGLKPDIEIKMTEEDYENNNDPQMDKAIEIIKEMR